jgi:class 3 adenylate cyclase
VAKKPRQRSSRRAGAANSETASRATPGSLYSKSRVRKLTNELRDSLEYQAAISEVLKIISQSTFDLSKVLNIVLDSAARLGGADFGTLRHRDGEIYRLAATYQCPPEWRADFERYSPRPDRGSVYGRTMIEGRTVHIPDVLADPEFTRHEAQKLMGFRAALGVPLMREGEPLGTLILFRFDPLSFSQQQIELVETFANQAVIAIENTRLFEEIQNKSRKVEEQAAELAVWNRTLETRVAEQVEQLGRMSKLTRFLSPKISSLIMSGEADDPLKTRRADITVVYVDLRGFTAFTETTDPEEVMAVLREYHAELGRAITAYDGTIEHFAGDGAMILFNAPMPMEDHELRAIKMALQIRESVGALVGEWRRRGFQLGFGAGIAGGYATMGTIGFAERLDYSAIGIVCNLAARLCGEAADGQILISPRVYAKVEPYIEAASLGELALKGFHRPVAAHNVLGICAATI